MICERQQYLFYSLFGRSVHLRKIMLLLCFSNVNFIFSWKLLSYVSIKSRVPILIMQRISSIYLFQNIKNSDSCGISFISKIMKAYYFILFYFILFYYFIKILTTTLYKSYEASVFFLYYKIIHVLVFIISIRKLSRMNEQHL